jgi:hypothetical protein
VITLLLADLKSLLPNTDIVPQTPRKWNLDADECRWTLIFLMGDAVQTQISVEEQGIPDAVPLARTASGMLTEIS